MTTRPLVIEFILATGLVGGTESQTARLAMELDQRGHRPRIVFLQAVGPIVEQVLDAGLPVAAVREPGSGAGALRGLRSLVHYRSFGRRRRDPADVVHAMMDGAIAASRAVQPTVGPPPVHVAGIRGQRVASGLRARLLARNLRAADAVVCNAPHLAEGIRRQFRIPTGRILLIPNGIDLPERPSDTQAEPAAGIVIANFHAYKGHDVLIAALGLLPDPPLIRLCGTGPELPALRNRAVAGRVDRAIEIVTPPADVPRELHRAQFAVHPSRTEGLSNAILEEMASGLPVVACSVGGNPQLIVHEQNGLLVPAGDPRALADAIARLAHDPGLRASLGRAGRLRAAEFSWDRCVSAHEDLYLRLLAARAAA